MNQRFYSNINPLTEHMNRNKSAGRKSNIIDIILALCAGGLIGYLIGKTRCESSVRIDMNEFKPKPDAPKKS